MKKIILLFSGLLLLNLSLAQSIRDNNVRFTYTQLPSHPIKASEYSVSIKESFKQRNEDSMRVYEQRMMAYQTEVNNAIVAWEAHKKAIDRAHLQAMIQYEQQIAAGNTAAQMPIKAPYPGLTISSMPQEPLMCKNLDTNALKKTVQVTGLNFSEGSPERINLAYEGLIMGEPRMSQKVVSGKTVYEYTILYSSPVSVEVIAAGRGVILRERIQQTTTNKSFKTQAFNTQAEFELWWMDNKAITWENLQDQAARDNAAAINSYLDERIGFPVKSHNAEIYTIKKDKMSDYAEYETAYEHLRDALLMLNMPGREAEVKDKMAQAIKLYNSVDVIAKKDRKNKIVNAITYLNLAHAYLWINDFANAELSAKQAISQSINAYTRAGNALLNTIKDQKQRFEANR
jgi:hypothetical protein